MFENKFTAHVDETHGVFGCGALNVTTRDSKLPD